MLNKTNKYSLKKLVTNMKFLNKPLIPSPDKKTRQ